MRQPNQRMLRHHRQEQAVQVKALAVAPQAASGAVVVKVADRPARAAVVMLQALCPKQSAWMVTRSCSNSPTTL